MAAIPQWLIGRHVSACVITPQAVDPANGVLGDGTSVSLIGHIDGISVSGTNETEDIRPFNHRQINNVILATGHEIELTEILKKLSPNILAAAWMGTDYAHVLIARGTQQWGFYGVLMSYREEINMGKSTGVLTLGNVTVLDAIDDGAADDFRDNPLYVPAT